MLTRQKYNNIILKSSAINRTNLDEVVTFSSFACLTTNYDLLSSETRSGVITLITAPEVVLKRFVAVRLDYGIIRNITAIQIQTKMGLRHCVSEQ